MGDRHWATIVFDEVGEVVVRIRLRSQNTLPCIHANRVYLVVKCRIESRLLVRNRHVARIAIRASSGEPPTPSSANEGGHRLIFSSGYVTEVNVTGVWQDLGDILP